MGKRSPEKLHELILYFSWANRDDPGFAIKRLTKDLYYVDFEWFRLTGAAITGSEYLAMPNGPMLEGLQDVLDGMQTKGLLRIAGRPSGSFMQQRPVPLREPDLALFTRDELMLIDRVLAERSGQTAATASQEAHELPGWRHTCQGERIPYGSAWFVDPEPTEDELRRARTLAVRLGRG